MTPVEFKSWFEGFTESMSGVPTKAQWARVKERVAEIDGKSIVGVPYWDGYLPAYRGSYYLLTPRQNYAEEIISALGRADFDGIN